jgi:DNA-binding transcriptional ArsR family regulator
MSVAHRENYRRELQDRARRHPLRLQILALTVRDGSLSLDPGRLRRELPRRPALTVVKYHLGVLREAGLVPRAQVGRGAA